MARIRDIRGTLARLMAEFVDNVYRAIAEDTRRSAPLFARVSSAKPSDLKSSKERSAKEPSANAKSGKAQRALRGGSARGASSRGRAPVRERVSRAEARPARRPSSRAPAFEPHATEIVNPELLLGTVAGEVSRRNAEGLVNAVEATLKGASNGAIAPSPSPAAPVADAKPRKKPGRRRASVLNGPTPSEAAAPAAPAPDVPPPAPALRADESAVRTAGGTFVIRRTRGR